LLLGFTHGVWLRLAEEDVSELLGSVVKVNCNDGELLDIRVL
jgi:hypothetical protein